MTKFHVPAVRPGLIDRPLLKDRLMQGLDSHLILVSAPPGFGKTTLLAEWLAACQCPAAWLSLDADDSDPVRFLRYLIAMLQVVAPGAGEEALELLQMPQRPRLEFILPLLINDLSALPGDVLLILDDCHVITAPPIYDALLFLLDHLPPRVHLVMATRADPPLPLARLRARGQLLELRADDLRFTPAEAAQFLNQVMGLGLSEENIAALETRTEGWIVGLQMAALSLRGRQDASDFVRAFSGSHRFVLDYLVEEVLNHQPPATQEFLLQTCILERLNGALCDAVTRQSGSGLLLEQLEKANLFLVPLDDERCWYRYHRLFADLLRARLRQSHPEQLPILHARATEWYERNAMSGEAISHALVAGDMARAGRLVEEHAIATITRGEFATVLSWTNALPPQLIHAHPWLCICCAWALFLDRQFERAEALLGTAEQLVRSQPEAYSEQAANVAGNAAIVRAYIALATGNVAYTIEQARLARLYTSEDQTRQRSNIAFALGEACYLSGDLAGAEDAWSEAAELARASGNTFAAVLTTCELAVLCRTQGKLHAAAELYRMAQQIASEHRGRSARNATLAEVGLAGILQEWNDLDGALRLLRQVTEDSGSGAWTTSAITLESLMYGYVRIASILMSQGDIEGARAALLKAEQSVQAPSIRNPRVGSTLRACQVRFWLAQGDLARAQRILRDAGIDLASEISFLNEVDQITLARLLIAQGELAQAQGLLARLAEGASTAGHMRRLIEILVLQALAWHAQGNEPNALRLLEKALSLAEPEGYVRTFVDEGAPMASLLAQVQSPSTKMKAYTSKLLAVFIGERGRETGGQTVSPASTLIEPLSERELEVLRLMAAGCSNSEIAARLILAIGTVKAHLHTIYGKLGVQTRTQAIVRAQELGLTPK